MAVAEGYQAEVVGRYWKASLAWKNIGDWAKGWTQESFINEVRFICSARTLVGVLADRLLDDMIHDVERHPNDVPGEVIDLHSRTKLLGHPSIIRDALTALQA